MPDKKGRFTPMERQFVKHFANTADGRYAAEKAGYAQPASSGSELAHKPAIIEAARAAALARIAQEGIPLAVKRHLEMLRELPPGQALTQAVKLMYQVAGLAEGVNRPQKEPHEMTAEELAEAISVLKRAAADKAKPVIDVEPIASTGVFD